MQLQLLLWSYFIPHSNIFFIWFFFSSCFTCNAKASHPFAVLTLCLCKCVYGSKELMHLIHTKQWWKMRMILVGCVCMFERRTHTPTNHPRVVWALVWLWIWTRGLCFTITGRMSFKPVFLKLVLRAPELAQHRNGAKMCNGWGLPFFG